MSSEFFPILVFIIVAPLLWLYFQNKKKKQHSELSFSAESVGLTKLSGPQKMQEKLANMPVFSLFATGTNKQISNCFQGHKNGEAFEIFDYSHGQMASHSIPQRYLVFSKTGLNTSDTFSLISKDLLARWRTGERIELELNRPVLADYRLYLEQRTEPQNILDNRSRFIDQFSQNVSDSYRPKAELINGHFVYYISIKNSATPQLVQSLIDEGTALLCCL